MQVPSKIGFHSGPTGNMSGIGDYWRQLSNGGIPIFHKAADGYGPLFEIVNLVPNPHNIDHHLVYRMSTRGQNDGYDYDVPLITKTQVRLPRSIGSTLVITCLENLIRKGCGWSQLMRLTRIGVIGSAVSPAISLI